MPINRLFILLLLFVVACKKQNNTDCLCTNEYNPVYAGENQYPNSCTAKCDGYMDSQITFLLTQEQNTSGILVSVDCLI